MMRILLIGHGRMGQLVEALAPSYGCEIAGVVTSVRRSRDRATATFGASTSRSISRWPTPCATNLPRLAARGINVVHRHDRLAGARGRRCARSPTRAGIGVLASANFSLGMNIFQLRRRRGRAAVRGACRTSARGSTSRITSTKKDAPSGTALMLQARRWSAAGYARPIDVSSTRAGSIPGTHTVGFDGPSETVTLTHAVRDRAVFARGALEAAKWLRGRRGWFTMRDMIVGMHGAEARDAIMRSTFTGVGTALVTPFTKTGALDEAAVRRLARRQVDAGVHFLVPCGTTGETPTLSRRRAAARRRDRASRKPPGRALVLAGAGGYDTREVIHAVAEMEKAGAQGILSVTPYYNKPTPEGLYQHYKAIAESTSLPIVVYNVPGRTGCNVDPATLARLATIPNIVGVKEASGNITQMAEICRSVPDDFVVLSGDDALTLPLMAIGGRGIISVASNEVPAEMVQMVEAAERGDFATARALARQAAAADAGQLRRVEPGPGEVRDGGDGAVRRGVPAADGAAAARRRRRRSSRVLQRVRPADRRRRSRA